jgi:hypothetical protein
MAYFVSNREVIKDFGINTGTSDSPTYTTICSMSSMDLGLDLNEETFFVFCDALRRAVITGASVTINANVKIDMENSAITQLLGDVSTLLTAGTVTQFNNVLTSMKLLTSLTSSTLTYTTINGLPVNIKLTSLGGDAEGVGEFDLEMNVIGTGTSS